MRQQAAPGASAPGAETGVSAGRTAAVRSLIIVGAA